MSKKFIPLMCIFLIAGMSAGAQNLLKNGDFELSPPDGSFLTKDWQTDWVPNEAGLRTTSTAAKEGRCGLWMYTDLSEDLAYARPSQDIRCTPGTRYKAEACLRTPGDKGWIPGSEAYISLTFKSASGVTLSTVKSEKLTTKNTDWKLFSINAVAPAKSAFVSYAIYLESRRGQSICNADNCSLSVVR